MHPNGVEEEPTLVTDKKKRKNKGKKKSRGYLDSKCDGFKFCFSCFSFGDIFLE